MGITTGRNRWLNAKAQAAGDQADLNIACLPDELLLDFEPGLTERITKHLRFVR